MGSSRSMQSERDGDPHHRQDRRQPGLLESAQRGDGHSGAGPKFNTRLVPLQPLGFGGRAEAGGEDLWRFPVKGYDHINSASLSDIKDITIFTFCVNRAVARPQSGTAVDLRITNGGRDIEQAQIYA